MSEDTSGLRVGSPPKMALPELTAEMRHKYQGLYSENKDGIHMSGGKAKTLFGPSGLNNTTLQEIWNIADIDNDGYLDMDEFVVAMYLILLKKKNSNGAPFPKSISELPKGVVPATKMVQSQGSSFSQKTADPFPSSAFSQNNINDPFSNTVVPQNNKSDLFPSSSTFPQNSSSDPFSSNVPAFPQSSNTAFPQSSGDLFPSVAPVMPNSSSTSALFPVAAAASPFDSLVGPQLTGPPPISSSLSSSMNIVPPIMASQPAVQIDSSLTNEEMRIKKSIADLQHQLQSEQCVLDRAVCTADERRNRLENSLSQEQQLRLQVEEQKNIGRSINELIKSTETMASDADERSKKLRQELDETRAEQGDINSRITKSLADAERHDLLMQELQSDLRTISNELHKGMAELSEKESTVARLQNQKFNLQQELLRVEASLGDAYSGNKNSETEITDLEKVISDLRENVTKASARVQEYGSGLNSHRVYYSSYLSMTLLK